MLHHNHIHAFFSSDCMYCNHRYTMRIYHPPWDLSQSSRRHELRMSMLILSSSLFLLKKSDLLFLCQRSTVVLYPFVYFVVFRPKMLCNLFCETKEVYDWWSCRSKKGNKKWWQGSDFSLVGFAFFLDGEVWGLFFSNKDIHLANQINFFHWSFRIREEHTMWFSTLINRLQTSTTS